MDRKCGAQSVLRATCAVKMQKYFGHVMSNRKTNKWHRQMEMPKLINNIQNQTAEMPGEL